MDLGSMSVKDLRSIITERGFSTIGVLTRDELVARAEEAMAAPQLPALDDGEGDDGEGSDGEGSEGPVLRRRSARMLRCAALCCGARYL